MKNWLAFVLCVAIPLAVFAGDNGYKVTYDGGSLPETKSGADMKMYIEQKAKLKWRQFRLRPSRKSAMGKMFIAGLVLLLPLACSLWDWEH